MRWASLLPEVEQLAQRLAQTLLAPAFLRRQPVETKADGSWVTAIDRECEARLAEGLIELLPQASFIGEESAPQTLPTQGLWWCVDPLDGTGNFVAGFPFFAISIALFEGQHPVLACVHDPCRNETFSVTIDGPCQLNGAPIRAFAPSDPCQAIGFCDFKRLSKTQTEALLAPHAMRSQRNLGACALEWAWLAAGRAHFLVHGAQALWDYAAGCLLAQRAGAYASDFAGAPLLPPKQKSSVIAAGHPALHQALYRRLNKTG